MRNVMLVCAFLMSSAALASETQGLLGTYYPTQDFLGVPKTRIDSNIDFNWGTGSPGMGLPVDRFSVLWSGFLVPQYSEKYTITSTSDDGIMVWVDGKLIIDNWTDHGATQNSGSVMLIAGKHHDFRVRYYENGGSSIVKIAWASPSTPLQIIPASQFIQPLITNPSHFDFTTSSASRVSPAWVEGVGGLEQATVVAQIGDLSVPVTQESATRWYISTSPTDKPLGIPLVDSQICPIRISVTQAGVTSVLEQNLYWEPTNLANLPYGLTTQALRVGDQLLLTATGMGEILEIDPAFDGTTFKPVLKGIPGKHFPVTFDVPGEYEVRATIDGIQKGKLRVVVISADLQMPIACHKNYRRAKSITFTSGVEAEKFLYFTADDDNRLLVDFDSASTAGASLRLRPLSQDRTVRLQVRIGDAGGPVLAQSAVDVFTLTSSAAKALAQLEKYPDGSIYGEAQLTMTPLIRMLDVKMRVFVAGVTFGDSTLDCNPSTDVFLPTSSGSGTFRYFLIRGPNVNHGFCHSLKTFQRGVQISN